MRARTPLFVVVVAALAVGGVACGDDVDPVPEAGAGGDPVGVEVDDGPEVPAFYVSPGARDAGEPGELLAEEPIALDGIDGEGRRITYGSTTPRGDVVHVTGVVITPSGAGPDDGRPVAVWAHPTVGVGTRCAPSLVEPFPLEGAQALLDAGFVVVAPDYDGLGSEGVHPYLVGESEGRNVLDAARAARALGGGDVTVVWGHSQGGHAALWARAVAADYAPDVDLRGVAAAAPPTDLAVFLDPGFTDPLILPITAQTVLAWSEVYVDTDLAELATEPARQVAEDELGSCLFDIEVLASTVEPGDVWAEGPGEEQDWHLLTRANSVSPELGSGPVFVSHGGADEIVPLVGSEALVTALCARGEAVTWRTEPGWTHGTSYTEALAEMTAWMVTLAAGEPAPSTC